MNKIDSMTKSYSVKGCGYNSGVRLTAAVPGGEPLPTYTKSGQLQRRNVIGCLDLYRPHPADNNICRIMVIKYAHNKNIRRSL